MNQVHTIHADTTPELVEAALFPLPNLVVFPGAEIPLHVFEPRYRTMVSDCVRDRRLIALCHTLKEIRSAPENQGLEEALNSNQATYKPTSIFSAGSCEVLDTTRDGRIYLQVTVCQRLQLVQETQTLPYRIARCHPLHDETMNIKQRQLAATLQERIRCRLIELFDDRAEYVVRLLKQPEMRELTPDAFSFRLFDFLRFNAELMQAILESTSALERLSMIYDTLSPVLENEE